jgi:type VI secretion system VasD/TssJ family lipoprotein
MYSWWSVSRFQTMGRFGASIGIACGALVLSGCASGGLVDKTMELVGLKPAVDAVAPVKEAAGEIKDEVAKLPINRDVTLRLHAGQVLNTDTAGRALSVVARVYKLKAMAQFAQATYPMFAASDAAAQPYASEVISVSEVVLKPGQKYEVVETLPLEATHLAVVALFRAPDAQRLAGCIATSGCAMPMSRRGCEWRRVDHISGGARAGVLALSSSAAGRRACCTESK